jgi:outer membrane receptor protein involved in Fe transport
MYESETAVELATATFQRNTEAAFIDDTWKVTPKLTLSLGLRYELTPPWDDVDGNLLNVVLPKIYAVSNAPVSQEPYYVRQGNCTNPYSGLNIFFRLCARIRTKGQLAET